MSTGTPTANWTDANNCPFCDATLPNPGAGFVDHIADNPDCESGFDAWRFHLAGDFGGA
jgi:hypothetical protein